MREKEENLENVLREEKSTFPKTLREKNVVSPRKEKRRDFSSPRFFFDQKRFTYTFLLDAEAASIHFDSERHEIFYKGHNIRNMTLSDAQIKVLKEAVPLLAQQGQIALSEHYRACLSKILNS